MSVKKFRKSKGYESLSREFLQRNDLSLEARGLLAYMESMPDDYVFHKTQLYKCFDKNKKTSVISDVFLFEVRLGVGVI